MKVTVELKNDLAKVGETQHTANLQQLGHFSFQFPRLSSFWLQAFKEISLKTIAEN